MKLYSIFAVATFIVFQGVGAFADDSTLALLQQATQIQNSIRHFAKYTKHETKQTQKVFSSQNSSASVGGVFAENVGVSDGSAKGSAVVDYSYDEMTVTLIFQNSFQLLQNSQECGSQYSTYMSELLANKNNASQEEVNQILTLQWQFQAVMAKLDVKILSETNPRLVTAQADLKRWGEASKLTINKYYYTPEVATRCTWLNNTLNPAESNTTPVL